MVQYGVRWPGNVVQAVPSDESSTHIVQHRVRWPGDVVQAVPADNSSTHIVQYGVHRPVTECTPYLSF